ncbi:GNAT family N-acetyltransferase [Tenacibaculum sp. MEBiC06402]|uniref:GNAT family N-acetyltransferase n=1 Tax=unclassified Tenacibaculum TaxID=2635139 RepID=UPI003B9D9B88
MKDYTIRLITQKDAVGFFDLLQRNKARLDDYFAGTMRCTQTLQETVDYCKNIEEKIVKKEYLPYLILNDENNLIGFIDFKNIDWSIPKAELGAFIDMSFEGRGIVTKSFNYLLDEVVRIHQFKKLYCRIADENTRSVQLAIRCGFKLEGVITRDYKTTKGKLVDLNYYGKII